MHADVETFNDKVRAAGKWVFAVSGTAARYATGDYEVLTDLTIGGIIDHWDSAQVNAATRMASVS